MILLYNETKLTLTENRVGFFCPKDLFFFLVDTYPDLQPGTKQLDELDRCFLFFSIKKNFDVIQV